MDLGKAFKLARINKFPNRKRNQGEVAELVGITQTYLSQIENGQKEPSIEVIKGLCRVYQIPVAVLFWMAIEEQDVMKQKKRAFRIIKPQMDALINEFFSKDTP